MREYISRNTFKYVLDEEFIPKESEVLQRLEKIIPSETTLRRNYVYRKLLLANKEKLLEDHGIETMLIKKKMHYVKRFNEMPTDPDLKKLFESVRDLINEFIEENEREEIEFKDLLRVITLEFSEINEKQITHLIKVLIDLEEIVGNKISGFNY